ncbi:HTH-type transcriptional regulator MalT [Methylobacterium crusticola]|uniref:HTH-type transcriptional regulator MalT n=1 Tax=Methylobacterium crusticola TaxID=1697972 RepID=A0ABQ4R6R1_9HYPH|nr:PAS domain S-box protein [Methylobacterium crusticola]GJD52489.1 HTH-type transcriptional regulator MalT [Methylobacterium crusticola]
MTATVDRSQLQQIIDGLSEGVILIETDHTITYANEAALAAHGVTRLEELGADITAYRRNFVAHYHDHQPSGASHTPVERVLAGEAFRDALVEVATAGAATPRWVHRIRSLVITDPAGLPDCLVLIIHDETERYEAEERFERAFSANPAPAAICRLADLRLIRVNQGFLDLTGYAREDVVGRSVYEVDVLRQAEQRDLAIGCLNAGRTIPQMEACLRVPHDPEKWVIVAGQPIEMPSDERCMLFTFADLEDRRKAEMALQHSQEYLTKAFQLSPAPTALGSREGFVFFDVNEAFAATFGYTADELRGRSPTDMGLWADAALQERFERTLGRKGSVRNFEGRLRAKDGGELDCLVAAELVTIDGKALVLCTMQDITERRRSENELVEAIEAAMTDASWFSRGVLDKLAALRQPRRAGPAAGGLDDLTRREREILAQVGGGASDAEISERLKLSRLTVRNHVAALYRKLGIKRRSNLVVFARDRGLTSTEQQRGTRKPRRSGASEP